MERTDSYVSTIDDCRLTAAMPEELANWRIKGANWSNFYGLEGAQDWDDWVGKGSAQWSCVATTWYQPDAQWSPISDAYSKGLILWPSMWGWRSSGKDDGFWLARIGLLSGDTSCNQRQPDSVDYLRRRRKSENSPAAKGSTKTRSLACSVQQSPRWRIRW